MAIFICVVTTGNGLKLKSGHGIGKPQGPGALFERKRSMTFSYEEERHVEGSKTGLE